MRKIVKGSEPRALADWKRANPTGRYGQLTEVERQAIREACAQEQHFLCAYCCTEITGNNADTMNEHIEARNLAPQRSLDFSNIVASCTTRHQCDDNHGSQLLPLTPLMDECETELRFKISGRVEGLTERAIESIRVLNLGESEASNKQLVAKRKQLSEAPLWTNGIDPSEGLEDEELLLVVVEDLLSPDADGRLKPFAPVVANILRGWVQSGS